ncbi:hypothetical protein CW751_04250 [Brumimicrobium salinarum]|uniref:DUF7793 domain-containing protein n=1 Tax=Brumimicrobium salinarum TaxID=2058658 RepID=A0A2I0R5B9_9FLAO|nr:STAS/SEC14 domain-containing protein [Brumimicrobium salinarum]PKR81739.1 hypothetical protein CW751_04250 [Brumimicrobium salinarum]
MKNKVEFDSPVAHIIKDERGFFLFTLKDTTSVYDLEETRQQFDFFINNSNGKPYKVLMDATGSFTFPTEEAFEYFFEHNKEVNKTAIVVTSLPMQLLMGHMLKHERTTNTKLFKSRDEAVEWLTSSLL